MPGYAPPHARGVYKQILLANPDQAVFVFAVPNPTKACACWIASGDAERQNIQVLIVANKVELIDNRELTTIFSPYAIWVTVVYTSANEKIGSRNCGEHYRENIGFRGPLVWVKNQFAEYTASGLGWKYVLSRKIQPRAGILPRAPSYLIWMKKLCG